MQEIPALRDGAAGGRVFTNTTANELSSASRAVLVYGVQLSDVLSHF